MSEPRPAVSVVVPFGGGDTGSLRSALATIVLAEGDELIVADNSGGQAAGLRDIAAVVPATGERSSYYARNAGVAASTADWILFMDDDCTPEPRILDEYFAPPPGDRAGAAAGEILGEEGQLALAARYARDRKVLSQTDGLYGRGRTIAATGNLLVRRAAFEELGGFVEGIRSAGDVDFCLRLQAAGWELDFRPPALVRHHHRETVPGLLRTFARYASGSRWLSERHPGVSGRWPLSPVELGRAGADAVRLAAAGDREQASFRLIDGAGLVAHNLGWYLPNSALR
jgi:cellulose synthase/poly-beta-1,6-N-acetylglucosamine synthase-like glycosyltransferase